MSSALTVILWLASNWDIIVGIVGAAAAVYKAIQAKQWRTAADQGTVALKNLIAALEIAPKTPDIQAIKQANRELNLRSGTELSLTSPLVESVSTAIARSGAVTSPDRITSDQIIKVSAILAADAEPKKRAAFLAPLFLLVFLMGCSQDRLVSEYYTPGPPPKIVVLMPEGVTTHTLSAYNLSGRLYLVSPLPGSLPASSSF